jgi:hypothetical protein
MTLLPPSNAQKILTSLQIEQKINRMAYEILEINYQEKEIVILGIEDGGFKLAGLLAMKVQTIQDIQIDLFSIYVNKEDLFSETPISCFANYLSFASIIYSCCSINRQNTQKISHQGRYYWIRLSYNYDQSYSCSI